MGIRVILDDRDDFEGAATLLTEFGHQTNAGNRWKPINIPTAGGGAAGDLTTSGTGVAQNTINADVLCGARVQFTAAGFTTTPILRPRFILNAVFITRTAINEAFLFGVAAFGAASGVVGGFVNAGWGQLNGLAPNTAKLPALAEFNFGGKFPQYAQFLPFQGMEHLAGGFLAPFQESFAGNVHELTVYVDEYQVLFIFADPEQIETYYLVAYPTQLRDLRALPEIKTFVAGAKSPQLYFPVMLLSQNSPGNAQTGITAFRFRHFDFTPRERTPAWEPLGDIFVATVVLDFYALVTSDTISGLILTDPIVINGYGPVVISPPTQYRDVPVAVQQLVVDNLPNASYLDVLIGQTLFTIAPHTERVLNIPNLSQIITISGGGRGARLLLFSGSGAYNA